MPTVIPVKFAYATRDLWFDPGQTGAAEGDHVICATERGTEIGLATMDAYDVSSEELKQRTSGSGLKTLRRIATEDDLDRAERLAIKGEDALPTFRRLVSEAGLDMKPVGVEYLFGGEKVVCYFAAEERVDFRQLVRDLARHLHERIDMRQIGVREEAALMGGFAHCGQELCCARFGSGFEPVSIRMAKEQDLPLNSNKISGACGRLMCCLRYEFEAYRDFKQRAPKKNAVIQTPLGTAKILEYDTPKEQIALRLENGKQIRVPLAEMQASEAACKKSEELGCPCRPDTVTRETMDRFASPEVRAALEEIDRKNGLIPEEQPSSDDLFVEGRGGRRRRNKGGNHGQGGRGGERAGRGQQAPAQGEASGTGATKRRRRRKTTVEIPEGMPAPAQPKHMRTDVAPAEEGAQKPSRRRRHHRAEGGEEAPQQQARGERPQRRRGGEAGSGTEGASQGGQRRRRRRPGDRGGQGQGGAGERQQRHPDAGGSGSGSGDDAPKRRRRRRRRPGDEGGNGGAPSAE